MKYWNGNIPPSVKIKKNKKIHDDAEIAAGVIVTSDLDSGYVKEVGYGDAPVSKICNSIT